MQSLNEQYVYKLKILIFGSKGCGKSSLVYTYLNNRPPASQFLTQDLNFSLKKEQHRIGNKVYECRLHMWQVATRIINNKSIKNDLFNRVGAYVFIYRDDKSLNELKNTIWPHLDFKKIATQPIYIILNDAGKERRNKIIDDFSEMISNNKQKIFLEQINLHDPIAVKDFFRKMREKLFQICGTQSQENWVLRDRSNKVVLRDNSLISNSQFQKRYNQCC